jgi:hypothetical protein
MRRGLHNDIRHSLRAHLRIRPQLELRRQHVARDGSQDLERGLALNPHLLEEGSVNERRGAFHDACLVRTRKSTMRFNNKDKITQIHTKSNTTLRTNEKKMK